MKVGFNAAASAYASVLKRSAASGPEAAAAAKPGQGFGEMVKSAAENVVGQLKAGEATTLGAVSGRPDMTQVVTAVSNAEVTLQAAVAVRDKVIQAYLDIVRMPI
ncbi:MAG: flagellar hook-basal body complex protein FliE [Alphaproteobacteria bacterium]|nr:flagellar hook-basal body complex protein FliE [Alphaproteobacteria bacterium]